MTKFNDGDIVIRNSGKKPAKIVYKFIGYENTGGYYQCNYLHSSGSFYAHKNGSIEKMIIVNGSPLEMLPGGFSK